MYWTVAVLIGAAQGTSDEETSQLPTNDASSFEFNFAVQPGRLTTSRDAVDMCAK